MLDVEAQGPVLRLTLVKPATRNALDEAMIESLSHQFATLPAHVRAVVLTGQGAAFCAGGDLAWMMRGARLTGEENYKDALKLASLLDLMARSHSAIIARVNGHCFGGGCGLVAASDVVVSTRKALFAFSEVRLGLIPATIAPYVVEKIGIGHARALFVTGETFSADRAHAIGLVSDLCDEEALDAEVATKIEWILKAGPKAVESVKQMLNSGNRKPECTARLLAATRAREEAQEGIAAFLEKRSPSFAIQQPK